MIDTSEVTFWLVVYAIGYVISFFPLSKFLFMLGKNTGKTVEENRSAAVGGTIILALAWPGLLVLYVTYLLGRAFEGFVNMISPASGGWLK